MKNQFNQQEQKKLQDQVWHQVNDHTYKSGAYEIKREGNVTTLNNQRYPGISPSDFEKITGTKRW